MQDPNKLLAFSSESRRGMDIEWNKSQERRKDVFGVAGDFNCEGGALRNRVGDRMSSAGGDRGDEGGQDARH
jgi:hypothetical protein